MGLSIIGTVFAEEPILNATAEKTVNDEEVYLGEDINFNLTVSNPNLDDNFTGVVVTDKISDLLEYVGNSDPTKATYDAATRTVTWNIGNLNVGEVAKLTIFTKAIATGKFNNEFNGTYNVTIVDQPAYDEQVLVGYEKVLTGWNWLPSWGTYYWGSLDQVNAWLDDLRVTYPESSYPGAVFWGPFHYTEFWFPIHSVTNDCYWAWATIPIYCEDPCKPIYECIHHPATYKNETRTIYAAIDPGIILELPVTPVTPGVSAATVTMEKTGAPLLGTILALLLITAGMFMSKRKP
jgi:fimbrial isopeptide formation D2 family protein